MEFDLGKVSGYLEFISQNSGFLRSIENGFIPQKGDIYVSQNILRNYKLREGAFIEGVSEKNNSKEKADQLVKVEKINGKSVDEYRKIKEFKSQTSINPYERINLQYDKTDVTGAVLNYITPIGRGQRGLIIAPPKTGKTTILKDIAKAICKNEPESDLFILLVDERPEEVTDFKRNISCGTVLASSADESVKNHLRITQLTMNAAMRKAEAGENVVVLIDSLTRMGRAFNKGAANNGRTMSGGLAANALELPRRFFGAARKIEHGGSLTVIATILVQTGSQMDQVIFQEFKGTGNMDLVLSKTCAEKRIFPAININESGTRKEELLLDEQELRKIMKLRRFLSQLDEVDAMVHLLKIIEGDS
jgi:transcription termination factor Rho